MRIECFEITDFSVGIRLKSKKKSEKEERDPTYVLNDPRYRLRTLGSTPSFVTRHGTS